MLAVFDQHGITIRISYDPRVTPSFMTFANNIHEAAAMLLQCICSVFNFLTDILSI